MRNWIRSLIVVGVLAAGALVTMAAVDRQQPLADEMLADSAEVTVGDMAIDVQATGSVEPEREVTLQFGMAYAVTEVNVREGDSVEAGDVLAQLDTADYELMLAAAQNALARAENQFNGLVAPPRDVDYDAALAALDAAEAAEYAAWMAQPSDEEIQIAELQIETARNDLWQGQLERDLLTNLNPEFRDPYNTNPFATEIQANNGLNRLETGIDIAQEQYQDILNQGPNGSQYGSAREQIEAAEIALENLLNPDARDVELTALNMHLAALGLEQIELQAEDFQLIAPFDGVVLEENLTVGELPSQGMGVTVANTATLTVDLEVDEVDVANLAVGLPVNMTVDALPEANITGTITSVDLLPLPGKTVPTYRATITLDPTQHAVRPGMSVTATVSVEELRDVVIVPTRFIERTEDGTFVTVIQDGEPSRVPVTLGRESGGQTQVLDGVTPGQRVVLLAE